MLSLKLALSFIRKSFLQSIIILGAIIVGISVQFFILSINEMLKDILKAQTTNYKEHITIRFQPEIKLSHLEFDDQYAEFNTLIESQEGLVHVMKSWNTSGTIHSDTSIGAQPLQIVFSDTTNPYDALKFYGLDDPKNIVEGRQSNPLEPEIMLGESFAKSNNFIVGQMVTYNDHHGFSLSLLLTGIYNTNTLKVIRNRAYLPYEMIPININHKFITHYLQIENPLKPQMFIEKIEDKIYSFGLEAQITYWYTDFPEIMTLNIAQVLVVYTIDIFISLGVFIVLLSILNYAVKQKYKQFGILKAMGLKDKQLYNVFKYYIGMIGVVGTIIGLILGTVSMHIYHDYMRYPNGENRFTLVLPVENYFIAAGFIFITLFLVSHAAVRSIRKKSIIELIKN